ncbi:MAG: thioredoxin fold domain-containing protein [Burkholderiaceae bacterium]
MNVLKNSMRTLVFAAAFCIAGSVLAENLPVAADSTTSHGSLETSPAALARFISEQPSKLAIVLVSTPGCGFCRLVRQQQLAPLSHDPDYQDVRVFEIQMRDTTAFVPVIERFKPLAATNLTSISSPAALSQKLDISMAPTVLFIGGSQELSERLVGYASPDFYWAYLAERIDQSRQALKN